MVWWEKEPPAGAGGKPRFLPANHRGPRHRRGRETRRQDCRRRAGSWRRCRRS